METALRAYEVMVILDPSLEERTVEPSLDKYLNVIRKDGGTVDSVEVWGRRRLAYEIQDFRDAFYVLFTFEAGPGAIIEIDRDLKLDQHVIRHLIVRYDELTEHEERAPRHAADGPPRRSAPPEPQPEPAAQPAAEPEAEPAAEPA